MQSRWAITLFPTDVQLKVYVFLQTIEKQTIDRMKRRHPNINNEILIEKRVSFLFSVTNNFYIVFSQTLNKLDHPNIVILYATFQDYGTLYYQMEYLSGGEVWSLIQDNSKGSRASVGAHLSLTRFFMAEAINALEYMHRWEGSTNLIFCHYVAGVGLFIVMSSPKICLLPLMVSR